MIFLKKFIDKVEERVIFLIMGFWNYIGDDAVDEDRDFEPFIFGFTELFFHIFFKRLNYKKICTLTL